MSSISIRENESRVSFVPFMSVTNRGLCLTIDIFFVYSSPIFHPKSLNVFQSAASGRTITFHCDYACACEENPRQQQRSVVPDSSQLVRYDI